MRPLRGHSAPASCARVSPDGTRYASGSYDGRVLVWRAGDARVERALAGHGRLINAVDWSPDGRWLASAASDHTACVWDVTRGVPFARLVGHKDDVNAVRFSPDGARIATGSFDGTVRVWRWQMGSHCELVASHHAGDVNAVDWLPGGSRLAAASDDGTASIFDADGGRVRRVLQGHGDWVDDVAAHPGARLLATASLDGSAAVWSTETGARIATLRDATCVVKSVAWSRDGRELAAASYDGCVRVYRTGSYAPLRTFREEGLWNRTLCATRDGWLTGSFGGGPVELGPLGTRRFGPGATPGLNGFVLTPDRSAALVFADDGGLYEIDLERREVRRRVGRHSAAVLCAAVSPDGRHVATGSWDRTVRLWDLTRAARPEAPLAEWAGFGDPVNAVAFSDCGADVYVGTFNGAVAHWSPGRETCEVLGEHRGSVKALCALPQGVVSVGRDGTVRRFGASGASCFRAGRTILNDVAVHAAARLVTASRRDGVQLWSLSGEELGRFREHACSAKTAAFSRDGRSVAMGYYDGQLGIWQPEGGRARIERVSDASLSRVAFRADAVLASAWDARGSLLFVDLAKGGVDRVSLAA